MTFTVAGFIQGMIYMAIVGYFFVVIYSIYARLRDEYNQRSVPQFQQPMYPNLQPAPYPAAPGYSNVKQFDGSQHFDANQRQFVQDPPPMYPGLPEGKA